MHVWTARPPFSFIKILSQRSGELGDLGLFDELLLDNPRWAIIEACRFGSRDSAGDRVADLIRKTVDGRTGGNFQASRLPWIRSSIDTITGHSAQRFWEALGVALAGAGDTQVGPLVAKVPEFWARSKYRISFRYENVEGIPTERSEAVAGC